MMLAQTSWRWRWNLWWCKVGRHQQQKTRIKVSWGRPWGLEMQNWEEMYWFKMHARHKKWKLCDDNSSAWRQPARHQVITSSQCNRSHRKDQHHAVVQKKRCFLWQNNDLKLLSKAVMNCTWNLVLKGHHRCSRPMNWSGSRCWKNLLRWSGKWRTLPARKP